MLKLRGMSTFRFPSRRSFLQALALAGSARLAHAATPLPRLPTVDEETRAAAKVARLQMLFEGRTPAELAVWQKAFAAELRQRLGPHDPPARWSTALLSRKELPDHLRTEWLLTGGGVPKLPLYLLQPSPARHGPGPYPVIVALHGHGAYGHDTVAGIDDVPEIAASIRGANYDYGRQLVREGYLVVAPCFTPFGRRLDPNYAKSGKDPCAITFVRLMLLGRTLMGENLRDARWALDFALSRVEARRDRVGCVGLSYGGRMTMLTTAFDERIGAAVISGALNVMQERVEIPYSCGGQVIPGLLEIGDTPEIGSLVAPRPCLWEAGTKDALIKPDWATKAKARLAKAYAASGKPENLRFRHFEGKHAWDGVDALPLLERALKRA